MGSFFVGPEEAEAIAANVSQSEMFQSETTQVPGRTKSAQSVLKREVQSSVAVNDERGVASYYIINYDGGGFVILSADKRTQPILAYSDKSYFPTDTVPSGLDEWLYQTKKGIEEVRAKNAAPDKYTTERWAKLIAPRDVPPCDPCCEDTFRDVGPLLQTNWGQRCGYNNLLATESQMGCSEMPCGRAYTGCVATAMAQIMRYHQYPSNYNWAIMPNDVNYSNQYSAGTNEIAKLMKNAGTSVSMDYDCDGSGSDTKNDVINAFNNFGYSHPGTYLDYSGTNNYEDVVREIDEGRPVLFRGGRKDNWFIFPVYKDGHAWVGDGFRKSKICNENGATSFLLLHMNWGWDNLFESGVYEGWYGFLDFTPDDDTFNYKSGVIIGIRP